MDATARVSVAGWTERTQRLQQLLEADEASRSLDDAQYEAAWSACRESDFAIWALRTWAESNASPDFPLLSIKHYLTTLSMVLRLLGDLVAAEEVAAKGDGTLRGVAFWMTDEFSAPARVLVR